MFYMNEIGTDEYEKFNQTISTYSLFQTVNFTESRKANYDEVKFLGLFKDKKIIATTQLLIESIPFINKKMGTSIKGINIDFNNQEYLKAFKVEIKKYLLKNNFLLFRFDLPIASKIMDANFKEKSISELDAENFTFPYDKDIKNKLSIAGFKEFFIDENYMGRSPQYSMLVNTKSEDIIYSQMNRSVKRGIKLTHKYGVQYEVIDNPLKGNEDGEIYLQIFYNLHQKNADINNINILPYEYYEELFKNSPNLKLFLASVSPGDFLQIAREEFEKKDTKKNQKIFDLAVYKYEEKNEFNERKKKIYILGHISGFYNKIGYDLFTGLDYDFRDLGAKEALMEYIFLYANKINIDYYDFWGILGRLEDSDPMMPIYNFKKKFSNYIVAYPGFWDVYTNKLLYKLFKIRIKNNYKKKH